MTESSRLPKKLIRSQTEVGLIVHDKHHCMLQEDLEEKMSEPREAKLWKGEFQQQTKHAVWYSDLHLVSGRDPFDVPGFSKEHPFIFASTLP